MKMVWDVSELTGGTAAVGGHPLGSVLSNTSEQFLLISIKYKINGRSSWKRAWWQGFMNDNKFLLKVSPTEKSGKEEQS